MHLVRFLIVLPLVFLAAFSVHAATLQLSQAGLPTCYDGTGAVIGCPEAGQIEAGVTLSPVVIAIGGGARDSVFLKSDGTVWDLGFNWYGKLGDGTFSTFSPPDFSNDRHLPVQVHGPGNTGYLNSITAIMGGESHNFALKSDGTVWAWGWNSMGQLGDGTFTDRYTPVQVSGLSSVIALGGRGYHSLALRSDGTVWAWGFNSSGQLGDGTTTNRNVPVLVDGLDDVIAVTGGGFFSLALLPDHTLMAWGENEYGQLGDGTNTFSLSPVPVNGLTSVIQASAGWFHSRGIALRWHSLDLGEKPQRPVRE